MTPTVRRVVLALLLLLIGFGAWMRMPRHKDRIWLGSDENHYATYLTELDGTGLGGWPQLVTNYIEVEKTSKETKLPPTRVLFLGTAHLARRLTGCEPIEALRLMSWVTSLGTLLVGAIFISRFGGAMAALAVTAFMACSPLLIHLAHRALIDGFFAFWALVAVWGLWESLRSSAASAAPAASDSTGDSPEAPGAQGSPCWRPAISLTLYGVGLAAMVLTKENAAFAYFALVSIIALNRWLKIGRVTPALLAVTFLAPALGAGILVLAAGGPLPLFEAYRLNSTKSVVLPYAIKTGDGPWHRYLLDFLLVSPVVTVLAVAALGATPWRDPAKRYLALFLLISYAVMAQIRYGMNMRYGAMWLLPLCWLAFSLLAALVEKFVPRFRTAALSAAVALVCAFELQSYHTLFVTGHIYDPVAGALAMPLQMWKPPRSAPGK